MPLNNVSACKGSWYICSVFKLLFPFNPWCAELWSPYRGYPAKRALSAMRKHGRKGPFGRIPSIYSYIYIYIRKIHLHFLDFLYTEMVQLEILFVEDRDAFMGYRQHHGFQWPGDTRSQQSQYWLSLSRIFQFQHQHRECIIHKKGWLIPWHLVHLFLTSNSKATSFSNTIMSKCGTMCLSITNS